MKKIYLVLLTLTLVACGKDDEEEIAPLSFPSTYTLSSIESNSNVRVFTKQGEVKDQEVISSFVRRHGESFLSESDYKASVDQPDSLQILSATEAQSKRFSSENWAKLALRKTGSKIELIAKDTSYIITNNAGAYYTLARALYKHTFAYFESIPLYGIPHAEYMYKVVNKEVGQIESNQLRFPELNFVHIKYYQGANGQQHYSGFLKLSGIRNELKENPDYGQIAAGDSVAIKAFDLIYVKK